jgi:hypothetical protein
MSLATPTTPATRFDVTLRFGSLCVAAHEAAKRDDAVVDGYTNGSRVDVGIRHQYRGLNCDQYEAQSNCQDVCSP